MPESGDTHSAGQRSLVPDASGYTRQATQGLKGISARLSKYRPARPAGFWKECFSSTQVYYSVLCSFTQLREHLLTATVSRPLSPDRSAAFSTQGVSGSFLPSLSGPPAPAPTASLPKGNQHPVTKGKDQPSKEPPGPCSTTPAPGSCLSFWTQGARGDAGK